MQTPGHSEIVFAIIDTLSGPQFYSVSTVGQVELVKLTVLLIISHRESAIFSLHTEWKSLMVPLTLCPPLYLFIRSEVPGCTVYNQLPNHPHNISRKDRRSKKL